MSGRLLVNHAVLQEATATLARAVTETEERLATLDHELAPLQTEWFGQAQQAWQSAQAGWRAAATEMHQLLGDLGARLGTAEVAYREADQAGARAFR